MYSDISITEILHLASVEIDYTHEALLENLT